MDAQKGTLNTFPDPRRQPHEYYLVTIEDDEVATLWRANRWRIALENSSEMQHAVGRASALATSIVIQLGGTILVANEAAIVAGGSTIILTLPEGYAWVAAGATFDAQRQAIIDGLVSAGTEAGGWNATVVPAINVTSVVRTSATVVTITLPAVAGYSITVLETITDAVPDAAIVGAPTSVTEPTFTVVPS